MPPPSLAPDDAPPSFQVPRMDPPPPSLEAMVQSGGRGEKSDQGSWWLWGCLIVAALVITGFVMR
jgi:hypothetical protein